LEFEVHRPLYDWYVRELEIYAPQQIEFARLNLTYTVMSKRKLLQLVEEGLVNGWDDPRMPTICGLRRRGYTSEAIRNFAEKVGVAKRDNIIDVALLEFCLREDLNKRAIRLMSVLNPVKLIIDNFPDNVVEELDAVNNPEEPSAGSRKVPFSKELFIEKEDFMENPSKKYFRLSPGQEVRLRYAYFVKCTHIIKTPNGAIDEIHCTYDPASKGGNSPDGRKVKGTIHWVSAKQAIKTEVRLYDRLFKTENPENVEEGQDYKINLNPDSLKAVTGFCEPFTMQLQPGTKVQFERIGYFCVDKDSKPASVIFNRTVTLKDSWSKISGND